MADNAQGVDHLMTAVDGLGALAEAVAPPIVTDGFQWTDLVTAGTTVASDQALRGRIVAGVQALINFGELAAEAKDLDVDEAAKIGFAMVAAAKQAYAACQKASGQ